VSVLDDVRAAIAERGGPLRFDEYMALALYGPNGFYTGGGRAGRRGDFITSPEVGPLFGTVLSSALRAEWERLGRPRDFTVIEVGAGPGTLARSILATAEEWLHHYIAVEVSLEQRALHPDGIRSTDSMPDEEMVGVVIANELLDNLPFQLLVFDGGWREAHVDVAGEQLVEVLAPFDAGAHTVVPDVAAHGSRIPLQSAAARWVDDARARIERGSVWAFDYVTATTAELAGRPWREWLRTYRGHERGTHYLRDVGAQDITAQVCLDQLPLPTEVASQSAALRRWGIDDLVEQGRAAWEAAAAAPTVAAMAMRSRVREAEALLDPAGLGGFTMIRWDVGAVGADIAAASEPTASIA
jgi:SAM-dependent MidA family methyltransferase